MNFSRSLKEAHIYGLFDWILQGVLFVEGRKVDEDPIEPIHFTATF
jgi:hypothetical protein